ncbi:MAG: hypothetical protein L0I76_16320 [Pseudonocardia sp.]|nr:hypothetical protein [Pseudonocardia sp.]
MAIDWTVQVMATGWENAQVAELGSAATEHAARAAATAALIDSARELGRHEFWVTVGRATVMVIPGLDYVGEVDTAGLWDALDLLPAAVTA